MEILNAMWGFIVKYIISFIMGLFVGSKWHEQILLLYKKIEVWISDPEVNWSGNINYYFESSDDISVLERLVNKIYMHEKLNKLNISKLDHNKKILDFKGILIYLNICSDSGEKYLNVKISDTMTNYKVFKKHLKRESLKKFLQDIVERTINTDKEFKELTYKHSKYGITLKFADQKDNFYLNHWVKNLSKENLISFNALISDKENYNVEYAIDNIKIIVFNNLDKFFSTAEKYALLTSKA